MATKAAQPLMTDILGDEAPPVSTPASAEVEPRESLMTFAQNHEPGQRIEMMGGFMHFAGIQDPPWTHGTRAEWVERYTTFRNRPA